MKLKTFVYVLSLLLPLMMLPLAFSEFQETKCAYVLLLVSLYWILETVPIAAVSMLPVVLFPLLGILSSKEVCQNYMKEGYMTFIGGIMAAISVENSKLHERIALKVLLLIGTDIKRLLLGIMLVSSFLSMWIANTATTAMMIPIINALVEEITLNTKRTHHDENFSVSDTNLAVTLDEKLKNGNAHKENRKHEFTTVRVTLLLGVSYAANIGGTGTLLGTPSNLASIAIIEKLYPGSDEISFTTWMMYNIPGLFLCVIIGWFFLWFVNIYMGKINHLDKTKKEIYGIISKSYQRLGPLSSHEASVIVLFSLLILLCIFRDPKFIPGWYTALGFKLKVGDSAAAISIIFLMFLLPSNFRDLNSPRILSWKTAAAKFPWSVIFLIGGGSALAHGAQVSGLSKSIGSMVSEMSVLPPSMVVTITCFITSLATEIFSHITVVMVFLPILSQMALSNGMNPLYLMLPTVVVTSYAFMLPIGSIPNAIVFEEGNMKIMDMVKSGIGINILCCCVQLLTLHTLGVALFDLNKFPTWADDRNHTNFQSMVIIASQFQNKTLIL